MSWNVNKKIKNRNIFMEFALTRSNDNETVGHLCVIYDIFDEYVKVVLKKMKYTSSKANRG